MKNFLFMVALVLGGAAVYDIYTAPPGKSVLATVLSKLTPSLPPPETKTDTSIKGIQGLKDLSELAVVSTQVFTLTTAKDTREFPLFGQQTTAEINYLLVAELKAGVDLSKITSESLQVTKEMTVLTLPPVRLLSHQVDESQSRVISSVTLINSKDLEQKARQAAVAEIETKICSSKIFDEANKRSISAVSNFLRLANPDKEIGVVANSQHPCQPEQPVPPASPSPTP